MNEVIRKAGLMWMNIVGMRQFRFLLVGSLAAGLYFIMVVVFLNLGFGGALAALLSYALAIIFAYTAQKKLAFRSTTKHKTSLPRYVLMQSVCAGSAAISAALFERFGVTEPLILASITTAVLGLISYYVSSRWVFAE